MAIKNVNKKTIADFDSMLSVDAPLDLPAPQDLLSDEDSKLVKELFTIISKYKSSSWLSDYSLNEMRTDLVQSQSILAHIMHKFGAMTSYVDGIEEQLKIARSKIRVNARSLKQQFEDAGDTVSITIDDLKDLSYTKTEHIWKKFESTRLAADFIKFIYFSGKDLVQVLGNTIQGLSKFE